MIKEKEKGNEGKLQNDKLYINGQLYQKKPPAAAEHPRGGHGEQLMVLSWNINGLCRKLSDSDVYEYVNDYDILLFSEI